VHQFQLLLPWRFFRLWALADGMDPPENMVRCMANNYSPLGFWRSWHRSYNLWIVRYIYIPLGGTHRLAATSILVFTFVALWHDVSLRLLAWGWLAAIVILPEVMARKALPASLVRAPLKLCGVWLIPGSALSHAISFPFFWCSLGKSGGTATYVRQVGFSTSCY
jgi:D-alanyl-lipoteichoic acid acyltransferase DltB (MBOAT superfamily)